MPRLVPGTGPAFTGSLRGAQEGIGYSGKLHRMP